jgi:hypothetical protein
MMTQGFAKLDLVTREEFEIQAQVLAKTRAKLEALEARLAELEARPSTKPVTKPVTKSSPRRPFGLAQHHQALSAYAGGMPSHRSSPAMSLAVLKAVPSMGWTRRKSAWKSIWPTACPRLSSLAGGYGSQGSARPRTRRHPQSRL